MSSNLFNIIYLFNKIGKGIIMSNGKKATKKKTTSKSKKASAKRPKSYPGLKKIHILGRVVYIPNRHTKGKKAA
jgi:hypothetical protein